MARGGDGGRGRSGEGPAEDRPRQEAISELQPVWEDQLAAPLSQIHQSGGSRLERRVAAWWRALGRLRQVLLVLGTATALSLGVFLAIPTPPPPVPAEWPALHATVLYDAMAPVQGGPGEHLFLIQVVVVNVDASSMTVTHISQDYRGLTLSPHPPLPLLVAAHGRVDLQLLARVTDCAQVPVGDRLPFLDVTFRNTRNTQQESEILGDHYAADLHAFLAGACHLS